MPTTTTSGGISVHYDEFGAPADPPMVLIQGLGAHMLGWHPDLCRRLAAAGSRVIRMDNRDVGLSQKFPAGGYTLADMADDVAGLLDALHLHDAHIVGQSMGGMIAQHVAAEHAHRVRSLTLIYTSAGLDHMIGREVVDERNAAPRAANRDEAIDLYLLNEAPCASTAYPQDRDWLRELGGAMYDRCYDPEGILRQTAALLTAPDRTPLLPAITAPTTIMHGGADRLIAPAASRQLHELIPGSTLAIHEGMGHELPRPLWPRIVEQITTNTRREVPAARR